ncbi:hypothetical protein ELI_0258 [Eubacterium callanderi]|uniref:Uncharacterized protein n=1 Tax=Eubacterium callanderi TaxID=53442 RepID=E3GHZ3_9FIRM|nr:hypothetical protein ELI_0258 [Eubacterium callanderi]
MYFFVMIALKFDILF